jgi:hypothetical protein
MMPHKFAKELTEIEIDTLKSCILYHKDGYCRMRAYSIHMDRQVGSLRNSEYL